MSGPKWCRIWRQVAHTSRPLTQEPKKVEMDGLEERETGKEGNSLVREGKYRCQTSEISGKGKGKGTGGKGEHDSRGQLGSKGIRWDTRGEETDEEDEGTRQDVEKMVMTSMKEEEEERDAVRAQGARRSECSGRGREM